MCKGKGPSTANVNQSMTHIIYPRSWKTKDRNSLHKNAKHFCKLFIQHFFFQGTLFAKNNPSSGFGSVGRVVASYTRDPWFESRYRQICIEYLFTVNCFVLKRQKEKVVGNGPFLKINNPKKLCGFESTFLLLKDSVVLKYRFFTFLFDWFRDVINYFFFSRLILPLCLSPWNSAAQRHFTLYSWSSLVEGDEGLYLPNSLWNLVIVDHELMLTFWKTYYSILAGSKLQVYGVFE